MALDDAKVRVGVLTRVYTAPVGTAAVEDLEALPAEWEEVGYTDMDALTESLEVTTEILRASQKPNGVRTLKTEVNWTWNFKAMETSKLVLELFYLGAQSVTATGVTTTAIPGSPGETSRAFLLEEVDGDITTRYYLPKGDITERGEVPHRGTEGVVYDLTVQVLGTSDDNIGYRITDDPNLAAEGS